MLVKINGSPRDKKIRVISRSSVDLSLIGRKDTSSQENINASGHSKFIYDRFREQNNQFPFNATYTSRRVLYDQMKRPFTFPETVTKTVFVPRRSIRLVIICLSDDL